jgi:SAM-dependent methyltransferase
VAAELVGSTGFVTGIDRGPEVIAVAAERARAAGIGHIKFQASSVEAYDSDPTFDLVIGRYVLIHQSDPIGFLRAAARHIRPGGYIAFHEIRLPQPFESWPFVPLWDVIGNFIRMACQSALPHYDVGERLIDCFSKAGLPEPELFCETPIGGGIDSPLYHWVAETLRSFLPQLEKMRVICGSSIDIDTLESRLRRAIVNASSQITVPAQVCAWARI